MIKICRLQLKLLSLVFAFSCLGLLLSANTVKAEITSSEISAYYNFSNGCNSEFNATTTNLTIFGGLTATSSSGLFGDGLAINGLGIYNGTNSGCYRHNKNNDIGYSWFDFRNYTSHNLLQTWAYSIHFKLGNQPTGNAGDRGTLISQGGEGDDPDYFFGITAVKKLSFAFHISGKNITWTSNDTINANWNESVWHHVVVQGKVGEMSTNFKVYLDNVEITGTWNYPNNLDDNWSISYNPNLDFIIGSSAISYRSSAFNGYLDDIVLFRKLLSTDEIAQLGQYSLDEILNPTTLNSSVWYQGGYFKIVDGASQTVPIYYNFCADYSTAHDWGVVSMVLEDFDDDQKTMAYAENFIDFSTGPQLCSGVYNLTIPAEPYEGTFADQGSLRIRLISDIVSNETLADSGDIDTLGYLYYYGNSATINNYLDNGIVSPLILNTDTATTSLPFNFNFKGLNWTGNQVCLRNNDSGALTSFCADIASDIGMGIMDYTNPNTKFTLNAQYELISSTTGRTIIASEPFTIVWNNTYQVPADLLQYMSTSTHALACSVEEWEEASESGVFNFTKLKCRTFETVLNLAESIANIPKTAAQSAGNVIKNIFPFNIPVKILEAFNNSLTMDLPENIAWLEATNENGDLTIELPANWNRGATGTELILWGDSIFKNGNPKLAAVFVKIRALSTYLIWIGFTIGIFSIGKNVYNEIRYQDMIDKRREDDWQL